MSVRPELVRWARERSRLGLGPLSKRFPKLPEWEAGESRPTLRQLESFAKATYTPVGYLFLEAPPVERLPIPDFRSGAAAREGPSPNLLDTVYLCQQRQEWYGDYARSTGQAPLAFIGSARTGADVVETAASIRDRVGFDLDERRSLRTWTEALSRFVEGAEAAGILVMRNGVVLSNTHRALDPEEFRGFALVDRLAPIVFINAADTKSAQMFTLAHELAHVWVAQSAVSDAEAGRLPDHEVERWCNRVAAELLVPLAHFRAEYRADAELWSEVSRLARRYKVSTLVVLRRIRDAGGLTWEGLWEAYDEELRRLEDVRPGASGGDFYNTLPVRASRRFARAVVESTLEGRTPFTEAFQLLGIRKTATFHEAAQSLGVVR